MHMRFCKKPDDLMASFWLHKSTRRDSNGTWNHPIGLLFNVQSHQSEHVLKPGLIPSTASRQQSFGLLRDNSVVSYRSQTETSKEVSSASSYAGASLLTVHMMVVF